MNGFFEWVGSTGSRRVARVLAAAPRGSGRTGATVRRAGVALLATLTVIAFSASSASALPSITVESGLGQVGSPDPLVTVTDSCSPGTTTPATIVPVYSDAGGHWIAPLPGSQWDSVNLGSWGCDDTYQATFNLPANATSPSLTVTDLADNSANVSLNGNQPFITRNVPGQCEVDQDGPPALGTTTSGFVAGVNTLTFSLDNCLAGYGMNPTGLDFVAIVTFGGSGPTVSAQPATDVQPTSATLHGTVNPNGLPLTDCNFYFYPSPTSTDGVLGVPCNEPFSQGNSPIPVSPIVNGLAPGTTYYVELEAANAATAEPSFSSRIQLTTPRTVPGATPGGGDNGR